MKRRSRVLVASLLAVGTLAAACGGDDDDTATASDSSSTTAADRGSGDGDGGGTGPSTPEAQPLSEPADVTIAVNGAQEGLAAVWLADAMGEFEKENVSVDIAIIPTQDALLAMQRGDVDLMVGGFSAAFFNIVDQGLDVRGVGEVYGFPPDSFDGFYVPKDLLGDDGDLLDPASIDKVSFGATGVSTAGSLPAFRWMEEQGVAVDDVEVANLGAPEIVVALENGAIQGGGVYAPLWQPLVESGCCELVTEVPALNVSTYFMPGDFVDSEPEAAEAVMRAIVRTHRSYLQGDYHDDADVVQALADGLGIPADSITGGTPLIFDPNPTVDTSTVQELQEFWLDKDILNYGEAYPPGRVVDESVLEGVL